MVCKHGFVANVTSSVVEGIELGVGGGKVNRLAVEVPPATFSLVSSSSMDFTTKTEEESKT